MGRRDEIERLIDEVLAEDDRDCLILVHYRNEKSGAFICDSILGFIIYQCIYSLKDVPELNINSKEDRLKIVDTIYRAASKCLGLEVVHMSQNIIPDKLN